MSTDSCLVPRELVGVSQSPEYSFHPPGPVCDGSSGKEYIIPRLCAGGEAEGRGAEAGVGGDAECRGAGAGAGGVADAGVGGDVGRAAGGEGSGPAVSAEAVAVFAEIAGALRETSAALVTAVKSFAEIFRPVRHNFPDELAEDDNDKWMRDMNIEHVPLHSPREGDWSKVPIRLQNRLAPLDKRDLKAANLMSPNGIDRGLYHPNHHDYFSDAPEIRMDDNGQAHVPPDLMDGDRYFLDAEYYPHRMEGLAVLMAESREPDPTAAQGHEEQENRAEPNTSSDVSQGHQELEKSAEKMDTSADVSLADHSFRPAVNLDFTMGQGMEMDFADGAAMDDAAWNRLVLVPPTAGEIASPPPSLPKEATSEADEWADFAPLANNDQPMDLSFGAGAGVDDAAWDAMRVAPAERDEAPAPVLATPPPIANEEMDANFGSADFGADIWNEAQAPAAEEAAPAAVAAPPPTPSPPRGRRRHASEKLGSPEPKRRKIAVEDAAPVAVLATPPPTPSPPRVNRRRPASEEPETPEPKRRRTPDRDGPEAKIREHLALILRTLAEIEANCEAYDGNHRLLDTTAALTRAQTTLLRLQRTPAVAMDLAFENTLDTVVRRVIRLAAAVPAAPPVAAPRLRRRAGLYRR